MNILTFVNENIATTSRPDEYKGTIAIDHHTAGISIEELIKSSVNSYLQDGFVFEGLSLYIGHPHLVLKDNRIRISVILSKLDNATEIRQFIKLKRDIDGDKFLIACSAIAIQFSKRINFEKDKIDWPNIPNPEE